MCQALHKALHLDSRAAVAGCSLGFVRSADSRAPVHTYRIRNLQGMAQPPALSQALGVLLTQAPAPDPLDNHESEALTAHFVDEQTETQRFHPWSWGPQRWPPNTRYSDCGRKGMTLLKSPGRGRPGVGDAGSWAQCSPLYSVALGKLINLSTSISSSVLERRWSRC